MIVEKHGQIEFIEFPPGWVESTLQKMEGDISSSRLFHPDKDITVCIALFYRGRSIDDECASLLKRLLESPPGDVDHSQLGILSLMLEDSILGDQFVVNSASTQTLKGRVILVASGSLSGSKRECQRIMVPADDKCMIVQEILLIGEPEQYARYLSDIDSTLNSLVWTTSS